MTFISVRPEAKRMYKDTGQAAITLSKLYFYLETNKMLMKCKAKHPVDGDEYKTRYVPDTFPDHKEWNYLISNSKYIKYLALDFLFGNSERLGNKMLAKMNEFRGGHNITKDTLKQHMQHHWEELKKIEGSIDFDKVESLKRRIENSRLGFFNTLVLHLHYM
jgi:hypothetical protein